VVFFFSKTNAGGALDATFGDNGVLRLSEEDYPFKNIIRIRQAVDKSYLVLIGNGDAYTADTSAIICFTSKGKIVSDFGNGGFLSGANGLIRDFDILADAKILALSSSVDTATFEFTNWLGRYSQLGISDAGYGNAGYQEFEKSFAGYARMDKVGQSYVCTGNAIDLVQLTFVPVMCKVSPSGIQDKTFGEPAAAIGTGLASGVLVFPNNMHALKDGGYLLDGYSIDLDSFIITNFITKIDKNGQTVSSFGKSGYLEFDDIFQGELYALNAIELTDGRLMVINTEVDNSDLFEMSYYLYDKNGVAVSKFGDQGNQRMKIDDLQTTVLSAFMSPSGKIFVGGDVTNSSDVYESQITKLVLNTVSVDDAKLVVGEMVLAPNPVTDKTVLTYELTATASVSVNLIDLQGRIVQSIVSDQVRSAGKQKEEISIGTQVVPGVYMLQVRSAGRELRSVKMVRM